MVQLIVKRGEETLFLHETLTSTPIPDVTNTICLLHNTRKRLERLVSAIPDLLKYGPSKPSAEQGYTEEQMDELAKPNPDPTPKKEIHMNGFVFYETICPLGLRTGLAAGEDATELVESTLVDANKIVDKNFYKSQQILTLEMLKTCFESISGALTIVYPQGLPEWDPVRAAIDDTEDLEGSSASKEIFDPNESRLWWAGKELLFEKVLSDFLGKNEKTKVIVKLQKKGQGPPVRELALSEDERKNMMAYYYKKQEELKKLEENEDDDYLHSSWADPKTLKKSFNGVGEVKFALK